MSPTEIIEQLRALFDNEEFCTLTLSSPTAKDSPSKATLRPLLVKGKRLLQIALRIGDKEHHRNFSDAEALQWLENELPHYRQLWLETTASAIHFSKTKSGNFSSRTSPLPQKSSPLLAHNRQKRHILQEGIPIPFLISLGIMNNEGKVIAAKQSKFRQINHFLEVVNDILPHLKSPLRAVDYGCGKAYLTFATAYFLKSQGLIFEMTGIDRKEDLIETCNRIARETGASEILHFIQGNVLDKEEQPPPVDLALALHACDTATDAALAKAILGGATVILAAPCCQHELYTQISCPSLQPLLKHGILKERFSALATDALRALLLEASGYKTQIIEFVDPEHTKKNILIKAIKRKESAPSHTAQALQSYHALKALLHAQPSLEVLL